MVKWITLRKLLAILILFGYAYARSAPSFRVIAPQTICEKSKNQLTSGQSEVVTISFYPKNGEMLRYKFQIYFKLLGNYRSQRRTLELWKSVRSLEERINIRDRSQVSERNLLIINKTEFMAGVAYIFHVVGTTNKGETTKSQNFTIKYLSGNLKLNDDNLSSNVNLLLLGSEYTLVKIPFILVAKVTYCRPRFDYYFQWNIPGLGEQVQKYLRTPRSVLMIPENTFKAGEEYQVNVSMLQSNTSRKLAQNTFHVRVPKRRFQLLIFPTRITTGPKQVIHIEIKINDFDGDNFPFQIQWISLSSSGKQQLCKDCDAINNTELKTSFDSIGKHIVITKVSRKTVTQTVNCEVTVEADILVNYEFENVPNLIVTQGQSFYFTLVINNLLPNCNGEWTTVSENGFDVFPQNDLDLGSFKVNDMERNYLSELSDFGNSTVSKEVSLFIPESSGNFEGLKGDSKYKLRLTVTCQNSLLKKSGQKLEKVKSLFEFIIFTNSPPKGLSLEVHPTTGFALQTTFHFTTGEAMDLEIDGPLSYEFLYTVDNITLSIGIFYEYGTADTILPYSESPIETLYRVCDVRYACSLVEGPKVKVTLANITSEEVQQKQQEITLEFQRMDFHSGQRLILSCALTYQKLQDQNIYNDFRAFSTNLLSKEIDKQYEQPTDKIYFSNDDMYKFVKLTKQNLEVLEIINADMIRKLLELLESAAEETEFAENIEFRKKRQVGNVAGKSIVNSDFALLSLELMGILLKSLNEGERQAEKITILEKVNQLGVRMCRSNNTSVENISTDMATLKIWKLQGKQIIGKQFPINVYYAQKTGYFMLNFPELKNSKPFCLISIQYAEDYLSGNSHEPIYNIELFDDYSVTRSKDISFNIENKNGLQLFLPTVKQAEKCLMWSKNTWLHEDCESQINDGQALCKCRRLGYIKLNMDASEEIFSTTGSSYTPAVTSIIEYNSPNLRVKANQLGDDIITHPVLYSTLPTIDLLNETTTTSVSVTASLMDYMLPLICIILMLLLIGGLVLYRKRRKKVKHLITEIETVEPRELAPGIKYGKFYDEHLLNGNL